MTGRASSWPAGSCPYGSSSEEPNETILVREPLKRPLLDLTENKLGELAGPIALFRLALAGHPPKTSRCGRVGSVTSRMPPARCLSL